MRKIDIKTRDGQLPVYVHQPQGAGPWPAAIMFMDAQGIRPAVQEIAERLAGQGYVVLLPDMFYRGGAYEPQDPVFLRQNPEVRDQFRDRYSKTATPAHMMSDMSAMFDLLETLPEVRPGPIGVFGYCMGGRLSLIAAGTYPDRVAVAASYHGGGLANDTPTAPHLLASKMKAKVYVAGATEDPNFPDEQKQRLEEALTAAGVDHRIETYPAKHGWVPRDTLAHDAAEAEHHWRTLIPLFDSVLKR